MPTLILIIIGSVAGIIGLTIVRGWVLSVLWGWFIVPTFDLPELSIGIALGIVLIIGMFQGTNNIKNFITNKQEYDKAKVKNQMIEQAWVPFLALLAGFIVKQFC